MDPVKSGRELDTLIAEKVMGWTSIADGHVVPYKGPWSPSTNIAHAWEVVEKVTAITGPRVEGIPSVTRFMLQWDKLDLWACNTQEAAHAICLAALTAVGVKIP